MARRTVNLPDSVDAMVREIADPDESFSAAVTRLIEAGARALKEGRGPSYIGVGEGPEDLGLRVEEYLRNPVPSGP